MATSLLHNRRIHFWISLKKVLIYIYSLIIKAKKIMSTYDMPGIYFSFKSNVKNLLKCLSFPPFYGVENRG